MRRLTTSVAAAATALALLSVTPGRRDNDGVREAVLEALLVHPDGPRNDPDRILCVEIWNGRKWDRVPGVAEDPSRALLERLQAARPLVRPQSECEISDDRGVVHRPTGSRAMIIGVAGLDWVSDDFVRVQGGWFYSGLNAVGWRYTLSLHEGQWIVDTETFLWVS